MKISILKCCKLSVSFSQLSQARPPGLVTQFATPQHSLLLVYLWYAGPSISGAHLVVSVLVKFQQIAPTCIASLNGSDPASKRRAPLACERTGAQRHRSLLELPVTVMIFMQDQPTPLSRSRPPSATGRWQLASGPTVTQRASCQLVPPSMLQHLSLQECLHYSQQIVCCRWHRVVCIIVVAGACWFSIPGNGFCGLHGYWRAASVQVFAFRPEHPGPTPFFLLLLSQLLQSLHANTTWKTREHQRLGA